MKIIGISLLILFVIGLIVLIPFGLIWSVNTLFNLSILYTFKNWLASMVLIILLGNTKDSIKIKQEEKKSCCRSK